jgi:chorismate synthase
MARNSIGKNLILTSFGESHGAFVGSVLDGFPAGFKVDLQQLQLDMQRRRPGQSNLTTSRNEADEVQIVSGIFEGQTIGSPITFLIANNDTKPADYDHLKDIYRPGHADLLYQTKYGVRDHRGGGRSSARITAGWVAAGSLAKQFLENPIQNKLPIIITAWVKQIHTIELPKTDQIPSKARIEESLVRCPDIFTSEKMIEAIEKAKSEGDSLGGIIACTIENCPIGLGEPVFGKLQAILGLYILNINAVKGISFGEGFHVANLKGSENNDSWKMSDNKIGTITNHTGGIIGGMATGEPIYFEVAFKPTSTIGKAQQTLNAELTPTELSATGRHDPCVLPRAVPIVEAMANLAIMDLFLEMDFNA